MALLVREQHAERGVDVVLHVRVERRHDPEPIQVQAGGAPQALRERERPNTAITPSRLSDLA
jgi:hypothetical protein